jgi:endonuclease YncB( thermonuclease family)
MRAWTARPTLGRSGTRPISVRSLLVLGLIALAAAVHALKHPEPRGPRAPRSETTQSTLVGRARVIDGDTIDLAGARIRLEGIDAPESDQSCADSACARIWPGSR